MTTLTLDRFPPASAASPTLALGASPELSLVLSAALAGANPQPDGLLLAGADWPGDLPPLDVLSRLRAAHPHGKAVGLIVVAADVGRGAGTLARLNTLVRQYGGLPVGPGVCVDAADIVAEADGAAFADITMPVRLALLGRRVATFARNRRILRSA